MRVVTWQGKRKVAVEEVPDPKIIEPTDAIIQVTAGFFFVLLYVILSGI